MVKKIKSELSGPLPEFNLERVQQDAVIQWKVCNHNKKKNLGC